MNTITSTSDTIYFVYFNSTPPTLTISKSWQQNTSVISNFTVQYIFEEINVTNPFSEATYSNIQWSEPCRSGYSCYTPTSGTISSLAALTSTYINISASGDTITESWQDYWNATEKWYYQNITIDENDTTITFFNITGWTLDFNDTNITKGTEYLKVWNGTTWEDITPATIQADCNTTPTYSAISVVSGTYYVCAQDLNGNGKIDYFKFRIPHTSVTVLQAGGMI